MRAVAGDPNQLYNIHYIMMTYTQGAVKMVWVVYVSECRSNSLKYWTILTEPRACKKVTFGIAATLFGLISSWYFYYYLYIHIIILWWVIYMYIKGIYFVRGVRGANNGVRPGRPGWLMDRAARGSRAEDISREPRHGCARARRGGCGVTTTAVWQRRRQRRRDHQSLG